MYKPLFFFKINQSAKPVFLVLFTIFLLSCSKPKTPDFVGLNKVEVDKVGFSETKFRLWPAFYNPNNVSLEVKEAEADIFIDQKRIGRSFLDSTIMVPRKDTFAVPMSLKMSTLEVVAGGIDFLFNADKEREVMFDGWARVTKAGITTKIPIRYKGMHKLNGK